MGKEKINRHSNEERIMRIETKLDNVCDNLKTIDTKLDSVYISKADKTEVDCLRNKVNSILWSFFTALIFILIGITGFLLNEMFFK